MQRRTPLRLHPTQRVEQRRVTILDSQTATHRTIQSEPELVHRRLSVRNQTVPALNKSPLRRGVRIISQSELRHRKIRLIRHVLRQSIQLLQMSRRRRRLELLHIRPRIRRTLIIRDALNPTQHHLPRRLHRPIRVLEDRLIRAQHPHLREAVHVHMAFHADQRPQSRILEVHDRPRQPRHAERFSLRLVRHPLHRNPVRMLEPVHHRPSRILAARRSNPVLVQDELDNVARLVPVHDRQQIVHPVSAVIPLPSRILRRPEMNQRCRLTVTAGSVHDERRPVQHRRRTATTELRLEPILVQQLPDPQVVNVTIWPHEPIQVATSSQTINSLRSPPQRDTHPVILRRDHR